MTKTLFLLKRKENMWRFGLTLCMLAIGVFPFVADAALTRQLQLGMRGTDVSDLQRFLATDTTIYPQGLVTGYFGALTQAAVSRFQARNGIAVVGRVGPLTLAAINAQMNAGMVGLDTSAPFIYGLSTSVTNNSATMNWNTSEGAIATIYYSTSPLPMTESSPTTSVIIGGNSVPLHTDFQMSHGGTLSGLQSNTTYYYTVYARDNAGNESLVWPLTFRTN